MPHYVTYTPSDHEDEVYGGAWSADCDEPETAICRWECDCEEWVVDFDEAGRAWHVTSGADGPVERLHEMRPSPCTVLPWLENDDDLGASLDPPRTGRHPVWVEWDGFCVYGYQEQPA